MKIFTDEDIVKQEICEMKTKNGEDVGISLFIACPKDAIQIEIILEKGQLIKAVELLNKYEQGS